MKPFEYAVAKNEKGALEAASKGYHFKASGVDLLDMLKERIEPAPDKIVSISKLKDMKGIREEDNAVILGALTTLEEIGNDERMKENYSILAHAAGEAATPQVRAVATAAGNICQRPRCWYFRGQEFHCLKKGGGECFAVDGENEFHAIMGGGPCHIVHPSNLAPSLVALDAEIVAVGNDGERVIPAGEFFVLPERSMYHENVLEDGELITAIRLPRKPLKTGYSELRQKQSYDWPMASCSVAKYEDGWRVVMGFVAPIPWRSNQAEKVLGNTDSITDELAQKAADEALADAEPMSGNAWRVKIARAAVRRALMKADGKEVV